MKEKKTIIFLLFLLFCSYAFSQNQYYLDLQKAEKYIVDEKYEEAVNQYHLTLEKYDYPFSRDLLTATCLAQYLDDKTLFYKWIKKCLETGLNEKELEYFITKTPKDTILLHYRDKFDEYRKVFSESIDYSFNDRFVQIDIDDQIRIFMGSSKFNSESPEKYGIDPYSLTERYIDLVNKYGFPNDKKFGTSFDLSTLFTDEGLPEYVKNPIYRIKHIQKPDIREKENDSVYSVFSYVGNKGKGINSLTFRAGNSFLWHQNIKNFPSLDSLLLKGIEELKIYPSMYAACLERYNIHYLIGMGGTESLWRNKLKMNINKINLLSEKQKQEINNNRKAIGIRSLEQELALHKAIIKLAKLKEKDFTILKRRNNDLFYYSLFNTAMP